MKKAFTLIELLVVVLIIGILAAIALPQYQKTVERTKLSEAQINAKNLQQAIDVFLLENAGLPTTAVALKDNVFPTELNCSAWDGNFCIIKGNYYDGWCNSDHCEVEIQTGYCGLVFHKENLNENWKSYCYTYSNDTGRSLCALLKNEGYEYKDMDY